MFTSFQKKSQLELEYSSDCVTVIDIQKTVPTPEYEVPEGANDIFSTSAELVLHMMSFMNPVDLWKVGEVCQTWKILSQDHLIWRRLILESKYPVDTTPLDPPKWAKSWQEVWKWFYVCKKRLFTEEDMKEGLGTYQWPSNGSKYEGEWKDNKENGRGTKYWPDGAIFEGEWKDSKFNGFGKHTWASGSSYEGTWLNHKRNGFGRNMWIQKDVYEGQWKDDQKDGFGSYVWFDGRTYEGTWLNDKRSGFGRFSWPRLGCRYEGQWEDDNRHGFGKFMWKDGDFYEGEWFQGKRFGRGKLFTKSGQIFDQEWKETEEFDASNKGDVSMLVTEIAALDDQGFPVPKRKLSIEDNILSSHLKRKRVLIFNVMKCRNL